MSDDLNDKELFAHATAETVTETPVEATAEVTEQPQDTGQPRDEHGRFAPKEAQTTEAAPAEATPAQAPTAAQTPQDAQVPSWRLREVNDAREAAERRAAEIEARFSEMQRQFAALQQQQAPKQEPIDFYADPNAALAQRIDPIQQQFSRALESQKFQFSEMLARQNIGDAKFDEIKKWAQGRTNDPALNARVERSPHPWGELAKSYDEHKTLSEIGTDPNAYVQKKLEEALKDPAFLAKALEAAKAQAGAPGKPSTVVQLPPSINRATSAASPHEEAGDMSDRSLFAYATR